MHTPSPPQRPCPEQPPAPHLNDSAAQRSAVQACSAAGGALVQALRGAGALVRPLNLHAGHGTVLRCACACRSCQADLDEVASPTPFSQQEPTLPGLCEAMRTAF